MVLVAYRHGLRAAELVTLRWDAIDFAHGRVHVSRVKGGSESVHPLVRPRAAGAAPAQAGARAWFAVHFHVGAWRAVHDRGLPQDDRAARRCGRLRFPGAPAHAAARLRLSSSPIEGVDTRSLQAYLGHRNIQHTVRYTELAPTRFKNFWHD